MTPLRFAYATAPERKFNDDNVGLSFFFSSLIALRRLLDTQLLQMYNVPATLLGVGVSFIEFCLEYT